MVIIYMMELNFSQSVLTSPSPSTILLSSLLAFSVVFYHFGCYAEYRFGIKDTARVVPVHGVCGLWSLLATGVFQIGNAANCNLHAAFEGLCYCTLRLPQLVCDLDRRHMYLKTHFSPRIWARDLQHSL